MQAKTATSNSESLGMIFALPKPRFSHLRNGYTELLPQGGCAD